MESLAVTRRPPLHVYILNLLFIFKDAYVYPMKTINFSCFFGGPGTLLISVNFTTSTFILETSSPNPSTEMFTLLKISLLVQNG